MEQDQQEQQDFSTELELHEKVRKAHLKRAISILVEGSKDEDYDDRRSDEAWKHITEASKQQGIADKISKKAATNMKKELEEMTDSIKKEEDHEGGDHEASSSSGLDRTSKEPSHPKSTKPCDDCHGTYCDMCNCTECQDTTCEKCLIAAERYRLRQQQPYVAKNPPPELSPQGKKDVGKMKENQKRM